MDYGLWIIDLVVHWHACKRQFDIRFCMLPFEMQKVQCAVSALLGESQGSKQ